MSHHIITPGISFNHYKDTQKKFQVKALPGYLKKGLAHSPHELNCFFIQLPNTRIHKRGLRRLGNQERFNI